MFDTLKTAFRNANIFQPADKSVIDICITKYPLFVVVILGEGGKGYFIDIQSFDIVKASLKHMKIDRMSKKS